MSSIQARLGSFIGSTPFYNIRSDARHIDVLEPEYVHKISNSMQITQIGPMGLVVLEDDSSWWVGKQEGRGFFHAPSTFACWTTDILVRHEDSLKFAGIYSVIWAFKDRFELYNREVMRAIIKCF